MKGIIIKFIIIGLSLFVTDWLIDSIDFVTWSSLVIAAIVFGLINAIFKPILVVLTLPITFLTLGLFLLVLNVLLFWVTSAIVPGFAIDGWMGAILGAFITWLVSFVLDSMLNRKS